MVRKRKGEFDSDQQSPSRKTNICLGRERVKIRSLKEMFGSTCFKPYCARRVKENTCSRSLCSFKSVPGSFPFSLFLPFLSFLFLYFHINSKSPSYAWLKLCDLLTYEMGWPVQVQLEKGKHSNSLLPLPYSSPNSTFFIIEYILNAM